MRSQWIYPKEFRIVAPPGGYTVKKDLEALLTMLTEISTSINPPLAVTKEADDAKLLVLISNLVWRMRRAMVPFEVTPLLTATPVEGATRAFPALERIWGLLEEHKIKIIDHTAERYYSGMGVIPDFVPSPDVQEEKIIDTIKPTIYHGDQLVQIGEVLVGTPVSTKP